MSAYCSKATEPSSVSIKIWKPRRYIAAEIVAEVWGGGKTVEALTDSVEKKLDIIWERGFAAGGRR